MVQKSQLFAHVQHCEFINYLLYFYMRAHTTMKLLMQDYETKQQSNWAKYQYMYHEFKCHIVESGIKHHKPTKPQILKYYIYQIHKNSHIHLNFWETIKKNLS